MAIAEKRRQLLERLQMLDELLGADPPCGAVGKRQRSPRIPRDHLASCGVQIQVDETVEDLRAAGDVDVQLTRRAKVAQTTPSCRQARILGSHDPGAGFVAQDVE